MNTTPATRPAESCGHRHVSSIGALCCQVERRLASIRWCRLLKSALAFAAALFIANTAWWAIGLVVSALCR